ncbi:hypothetical protein [Corynebacterium kalidii]
MNVSPTIFILTLLAITAFMAGGAVGTTWSVALGMIAGFTLIAATLHLLLWNTESQYQRTVRRLLRGYLPPRS